MGKWKELGVVPDSEDEESFVSDDSSPLSTPPDSSTHSQPSQPPTSTRSIGGFSASHASSPAAVTASLDTSGPTSNRVGQSSSLGEHPTSPSRPDHVLDNRPLLYRPSESPDPLGEPPTRLWSTAAPSHAKDPSTPSPSIVRPTLFPASSLGRDEPNILPSHETEEEPSAPTPANLKRPVLQHALPASESPERGRRSLRPRKPIQEHPYLLENEKYSRFMKTHGVKPVRVSVPQGAPAIPEPAEDSQDRDYTGDESQPTSGLPDEGTQGGQHTPWNTTQQDDFDELALSPSPKTSSPRHRLRESSLHSPAQHTDDTILSEDEDFPDIEDLLGTKRSVPLKPTKRPLPAQSPTSRKRTKTKPTSALQDSSSLMPADVWDLPLSPDRSHAKLPQSSPISTSVPVCRNVSNRATSRTPSPQPEALSPHPRASDAHLILISSGESTLDDEKASSEPHASASESDSDMMRRTGKRIKGVLPASWLRLDQQTRKVASRKTAARASPPRDLDQPRLGLATRTFGRSKSTASTRDFLDELNDDREDDITDATRSGYEASHRSPEQAGPRSGTEVPDFDDGASVVEEDVVDRMLPGNKRRLDATRSRQRKRQKTQQKAFPDAAHTRYQQPKISQSFHHSDRSDRLSTGMTGIRRPATHKHNKRQVGRLKSPPALSIVDFIQPNAPNFVKVAARAASRRKDMGRSKPSYKNIDLGNRTDNVDARSVLMDWRSGKLRPSSSMPRSPNLHTRVRAESQIERHPLRALSTNTQRRFDTLSFARPQKLTKQLNIDRFTTSQGPALESADQPTKPAKKSSSTSCPHNNIRNHRPAQLEDETPQDTGVAFSTRKKMLDLVFRRNNRGILAPTFKLQQPIAASKPVGSGRSEAIPHNTTHEQQYGSSSTERQDNIHDPETTRRRSRKAAAPRRLDLKAPQFRHANDPLPVSNELDHDEVQSHLNTTGQSKLVGLGPFGTHYTQHFDIFPLHEDTYFHHKTLIGDGTLKRVLDSRPTDVLKEARPATIFDVFDHHFCWDAWTDSTSSELGLLFDLLTEQLERDGVLNDSAASRPSLISCADYVLKYLSQSARLEQEDRRSAFTQRLSKILLGFLESTKLMRIARSHDHTLLGINVRFLMCALVVLRLCQGAGELSRDCLQAESIVQQYARVVVQQLLEFGLSPIRSLYDDLQRLSTLERGIRNDATLLISWVIVIQVLGSAQIPRVGFWDLTSSVMATAATLETNDARKFEAVWENMFTLLPLGEFDDIGVLSKNRRHTVSLQGWVLPQKLLRPVFDSYQRNEKQSPSFNEYCRTLLARCHYLIEQWGWYKCVGIVGTIFDFFGSRHLSHLRNEEAYKSPDFLEELSGSPCLSVQPGDRCFHVFLKLLALAIQHLRDQNLSNDIRNLIARCLPNHNRQYSKEQTVHFDDLASLRNHHDLLCTLFWSAPREDRRPVELIEKLVSPANSHKEACLINLRAWNQLARFVVSSGGTIDDYRPFMSWQNNIFQPILTQYLTAATDVQQQFMSLAKEKRKDIQQHMLDGIVKANQEAAKDVLYASVQASLDIMKHCPSLVSATFTFNVPQTSKVFDKIVCASIGLDWGILRACFDTIDLLVLRLEELWFQSKQASADSISSNENRGFEDAVEFLDDKVVRGFFAAVRRVMGCNLQGDESRSSSPAVVVEKAIILCGRIASLFIDGEKRQIRHFFSPGNSDLFGGLPHELGPAERKFVPLFVATLLKNHVFNFSGIGCSHFDIWILSLVKPFTALRYENYLAQTLKALDIGYMEGASVIDGAAPSYDANRHFFACGVMYMRRELRQADVAQRKPLRTKYERLLKLVMQQMKTDLKSLELNSVVYRHYISFVHDVVGLIKSHGADICTVDPFYYQVSAEYSPAKEDPQLHTAGILAYGLRLEEGEMTAIPQLYHYLYNHFKSSLASGQIEAEVNIVQNGTKDDNILAFVIGRMLPAIISTSSQYPYVWPLLGVYSTALQNTLGKYFLPREIPLNQANDVAMLLETIIDWFRRKCQSAAAAHAAFRLTATDAHVFTELIKICNAIRPTLLCWLLLPPQDRDPRIQDCLDVITALASSAITCFDNLGAAATATGDHQGEEGMASSGLFAGWQRTVHARFPPQVDSHVASFAQNLERELRTSWVVTEDAITAKAAVTSSAQAQAAGGQGKAAAGGVKNELDRKTGQIFASLLAELRIWVDEVGPGGEGRNNNPKRRRRPRRVMDDSVDIERLLYGV